MARLPVICAIPNYNMARELKRLLPQVLAQNYDQIFVLDDASSDNSREVVQSFGSRVTLVTGGKNLGAGANRNRILTELKSESLIHFIDADCELVSKNNPEIIRRLMTPDIGLLGGLVADKNGRQSIWNWGPRFSLYSNLSGWLQDKLNLIKNPRSLALGYKLFDFLLNDWPNPLETPQQTLTYWVLEANMVINSKVLAEIGGFDENLRDHDIVPVAIKIQENQLKTLFDPQLAVIHHNDTNVRPGNRKKAIKKAAKYLRRTIGLKDWLLPGGHFKPRHNQ